MRFEIRSPQKCLIYHSYQTLIYSSSQNISYLVPISDSFRIIIMGGGVQPIIRSKFSENCMKMKTIGSEGGCPKLYYADPQIVLFISLQLDIFSFHSYIIKLNATE